MGGKVNEVKVKCDECSEDLTYSRFVGMDFRLKLSSEELTPNSMVVSDYYMERPFKGYKHFCNLGCLKKWMEK